MSAIQQRYDASAEGYQEHWAPVLEPTGLRLIEEADAAVRGLRSPTLLDIGTGTGTLARAALRRWPDASVIGVDASRGMLATARRLAGERLSAEERARLDLRLGEADRLPLADRSVDLCLSAFVFQLVPDRPAALREALRVLRAGGRLGFVTWQDDRRRFAAWDEFDEAVVDVGIDEDEDPPEDRAGDLASPRAAADELRRVGFRRVSAQQAWLEHAWTRESFLDYKLRFDERDLMTSLDEPTRERLAARARERLAVLPEEDFRWRSPVVVAWASRPG
jgi:SAM-dependent methyltransferase